MRRMLKVLVTNPLAYIVAFNICGAASIVAGVFLLAGKGYALVAAGAFLLAGAAYIAKGLTPNG